MKIRLTLIIYFLAFLPAFSQNNHNKTSFNLDRWLDLVDLRTHITFTEFRYDRFVSQNLFTTVKNDTILILNMTILENGKIMKENGDSVFNNKLNLYIQDWLYTIVNYSNIHEDGFLWRPAFTELQLILNGKNLGKLTNRFFSK